MTWAGRVLGLILGRQRQRCLLNCTLRAEEDDAEDALRAVVVGGVGSGRRRGAGPVLLPLLLLHGILRGSEQQQGRRRKSVRL